jgi:hypothetical protein
MRRAQRKAAMDTTIEVNPETGAISEKNPVRIFFELSGKILFEPSRFFREDLGGMSLSDSATFGLIGAWVATMISFLWETVNSLVLAGIFEKWVQRLLSSDESFALLSASGESFLWSAGILLLVPFLLLLRIAFTSIAMFVFAKLLIADDRGAPDNVTYKNVLRIQGASLSAKWFLVVPFFGGLLSYFAFLIFTVTGIRERFSVSTRRAAAVVLAPYLVLLAMVFMLVLVGIYAFSQLPFQEMMEQMKAGGDLPF